MRDEGRRRREEGERRRENGGVISANLDGSDHRTITRPLLSVRH